MNKKKEVSKISTKKKTVKTKKEKKEESEPKTEEKPEKIEKIDDKIKKGDLILVDLVGRLKSNNKLFDVTSEDLAKKENVYSEKEIYGPRFAVVGDGWVLDGVDAEIQNMVVGETKMVELVAKDAFGERNPANIQMYGERKIRKQLNIDPSKNLGKRITIGGKPGYIIKVQGGRVRVDHNHPLAGEDITYEVTITKKLTDDQEKIEEFVKMNLRGIDPKDLRIEMLKDEKLIKINLPNQVSLVQGIGYAKFGISQNVFKYLDGIEKVEFVELFEKKMFDHSHDHEHEH